MNRLPRRNQSRANAILSMLPGNNTDPPLLETTGNTGQQKKVTDVTKLFTRPYSMVEPVFKTFCETQITYDSYHSQNLQENIDILNKAFPQKPEEVLLKPVDNSVQFQKQQFQKQLDYVDQVKIQLQNSSPRKSTQPLAALEIIVNPTDVLKKSIPEKQNEEVFLEPFEKSSAVCQDFSEQHDSAFDPINLLCNEKMPSENSPPQISTLQSPAQESSFNQAFVFDSDDSVLDKDYCPSRGESSDSDEVPMTVCSKKKKVRDAETFSALVPFQQLPRQTLKPNNLKRRRHTVDAYPTRKEETHARKRKKSTGDLDHNNNDDYGITPLDISIDLVEPEKKRKRYTTALKQRQMEARNQKRMTHYQVKPGCKDTCFKKCMANFTQDDRRKINDYFRNMTWQQRHAFVKSHTAVAIPKRKITKVPERNPKRKFSLKNVDGVLVDVCKIFFLTTLGFEKSNDKILYTTFTGDESDKRGSHKKTPLIDRDLLTQHVESFNPVEPHYRREHAPLRRYIASDISIATMHKHFQEKYPSNKVSYELYRKHVRQMNISFTRLGNEECEMCETYRLHKLQSAHDATTQTDCNDCTMWTQHHNRYKKAREMYDAHKQIAQNSTQIYFSADLEKVIMLPRMESFKSLIFCQRLVAFNQTFAPLGRITNESKPVAVIWHDGIAGRRQEDIMSAFYFFILRNRDVKNVNIWLDNCSAQNKNWLLYSLLVHLICASY